MKKIVMILLLLNCIMVTAQDFKKTGTAGFTFLQIPITARTASLGEASVALADNEAASLFINPAGLSFGTQSQSFSATYGTWFADIKQYASSYSISGAFGTFAVGAMYMDYGEMTKTKKTPGAKFYDVLGTFNSSALALSAGYSKRLTDKFSFGVSLKYVRESIDEYNASNVVFDGGVLYYTGLRNLRIAALIQNFGTEAKFKNDPFKMPSILKLGLADEILGGYGEDYRVTLIAEALHPNDGDERVNAGLEISYQEMITLRGGYKFFYDEETYSFGFGFNPKLQVPIVLDFSMANYGRLGDLFRVSIQLGMM